MHIGIILDGNRRYAKKHKLDVLRGHWEGADKVDEMLNWVKELGIDELTLYALSLDNLKNRSSVELKELFKVITTMLEKRKTDSRIDKDKVRIRFAGRIEKLPQDMQGVIKELEYKTKDYEGYKLTFCLAYSGKDEIINSMEKIKEKDLEVNEENIKENLWINSYPEIVIRTGGKARMSDFMPFQTTYSEWFFLDKMWPEFTKEDLVNILEKFKNIERNFGK